jgi:hypothetical protein
MPADASAKTLDRFRDMFAGLLPEHERIDFYANHRTDEGDTYLRLESYAPQGLSRLVLEEYTIRGRMHGTVIMAFPTLDTETPIFFFQLGGVGPRSIAVLDISPTTPDLDLTPLEPIHARYAQALGLEPTSTDWLQSICSPYLLHCNYAELDTELFTEAVVAYATVWRDAFLAAPTAVTSGERRAVIRNRLYKFKYQLHHHDPAYEFFVKAWGKPAADAFVDLECSDDPGFLPPDLTDKVKPWRDDPHQLLWDERAQRRVAATADDRQGALREAVEQRAIAAGYVIVTEKLLDDVLSTTTP